MDTSMFSTSGTWDRYGPSALSRRMFMLMVCFWTAVGVGVAALTSRISQSWEFSSSLALVGFALAVLAVAVLGIIVSNLSDNPVVSLFGYALVAGPFGLLLGPVMAQYEGSSVVKVFALTSAVVLLLGFIGAMIPQDLSSWGTPLLGALLLLIGGYFLTPILSMFGVSSDLTLTWLDWIGLIIFGALVLFDLNQASRMPYTHDNAIDAAVGIYLDFINIFIRLLSLFLGNSSSD